MLSEAQVIERAAQPYVAIRAQVTMRTLGTVLPALHPRVFAPGRYAALRYTGHPDGLLGATASLLKWAEEHNLAWDVRPAPDGERWGARLEIYETDPAAEPDMSKWTTQLAFRLAGQ
jgi:hypothetical protein